MGCASSKKIDSSVVDYYRPPATGFAVFDINAIKEPWLMDDDMDEKQPEKPTADHMPSPILAKIESLEEAPRTWDEVSKALEDLKPTLHSPAPPTPDSKPLALLPPPPAGDDSPAPLKKVKRKSFSFHTLEELDDKKNTKPVVGMKKTESLNELNKLNSVKLKRVDSKTTTELPTITTGSDGFNSFRDNPFLQRDKIEREREGKPPIFSWDPLTGYPEKCPPGGENKVVIYTTSLGGVRRPKEDCNTIRSIMELHGFVFEERDISLHGVFLTELKELLGEPTACVPRMFVKGKYIGGVEEVVRLNEIGRLRRMLSRIGIERRVGRQGCEGCGGARFVPCLDCGGSCKVVVEGKRERCPECNENGLVYCPVCS